MPEAVIAQKSPFMTELDAGKNYFWCRCGKSAQQPFCDGSHKGSEFAPVHFQVENAKTYALCGCKRSGNQPYCDGSHNKL